MPILWGEKSQTRKSCESIETGNNVYIKQTFEKVYIVIGDSPDEDPLETVKKTEIPVIGVKYLQGFCSSIDVAEADFIPNGVDEGLPIYEVTVKFDTSLDRDGGGSGKSLGNQQPESQVPDYNLPTNTLSWSCEESPKKLTEDFYGRKLINPIGEKIEVEIQQSLRVAEMVCYTMKSIENNVLDFHDTVNDRAFAGYARRRIKVSVSIDYEDIDLGDEEHTICKWKKVTLRFTFDKIKGGTAHTETITYPKITNNGEDYTTTTDSKSVFGDEEFCIQVPNTGKKCFYQGTATTTGDDGEAVELPGEFHIVEVQGSEEVNLEYNGKIRSDPEPLKITFENHEMKDFSELSAYLDCDIEDWLINGLETNADKHTEKVMNQMSKKNKRRNRRVERETKSAE